ncbi:substrate-binding domain-containing protein [Desertivirga brevis]|uniref:substrate-binding domain-containing protein n=1 Tax=Desertivirga brevis TaxID=2810310 RepID=UPI001A96EB60|nr:substrate-binding domain-containing protein [Pedobacter sp. SYSU D00873]
MRTSTAGIHDGFFEYVQMDMYSSTPKYLQLAHSILDAIKKGKIKKNILLPSLNELTYNLEISRETADKSYKYLQSLGILNTIPGKGHYITTTEVKQDLRICLLINKISNEKKNFYEAFVAKLGMDVPIDFYIYNNDFLLFKKFFSKKTSYSHYLIMPHFTDSSGKAESLINTIDKGKLILLDKKLPAITGNPGLIYENFKKDIYTALEKALVPLSRYHTLKLVFPERSYYPKEIIQGFNSFCLQYAFEREVVGSIEDSGIEAGQVYICLCEDSLIKLLEKIQISDLKVGKDIGVISYNESPIKKIILNGITTISTDYRKMGEIAADMIKNNYRGEFELPFTLNIRPSL